MTLDKLLTNTESQFLTHQYRDSSYFMGLLEGRNETSVKCYGSFHSQQRNGVYYYGFSNV